MTQEEKIRRLAASFTLAATQINESGGKGYRISLYAPWRENGLGVKYYHVQLCGIDPLGGGDVKEDNVFARFDFSKTSHKTEVLTYHGQFRLCCTAYLADGSIIPFKDQEITLNYPQNCPYIKYEVTGKGDFKYVRMESNCWGNCADKVWLRFDGHEQRMTIPPRYDKTVRFYVPAAGTVEVKVQDDLIQVRNGW